MTYSSICVEYASYGWICVAIEHRDGSGPRTFVNYADGKPPRVVDYIHPKGGNDTVNDTDRETDHELRDAQITMRKREIEEVHQCWRGRKGRSS
jgi:platelet-activating factor acetylhydrolase